MKAYRHSFSSLEDLAGRLIPKESYLKLIVDFFAKLFRH